MIHRKCTFPAARKSDHKNKSFLSDPNLLNPFAYFGFSAMFCVRVAFFFHITKEYHFILRLSRVIMPRCKLRHFSGSLTVWKELLWHILENGRRSSSFLSLPRSLQ